MMLRATDIEIVVARHFHWRQNLIVPNVSWGIWDLGYEADMVVLRPSGYALEVEIKVTKSDIKADLSKRHTHNSKLFRELWFAVPAKLAGDPNIPKRAGILAIHERYHGDGWTAIPERMPQRNKEAVQWDQERRDKLLHLGCMRIWSLKEHLATLRQRGEGPRGSNT
jgi:hypothetical protein